MRNGLSLTCDHIVRNKSTYYSGERTSFADSLWIILGPTASGKTRTAVELAKAFDGEIISADSRQVYRHMDIGTGKDLEEYDQIPHHLINIAEPGERYQVDRFRDDFFAAYDSIMRAENKLFYAAEPDRTFKQFFSNRFTRKFQKTQLFKPNFLYFLKNN